MENNQRFNLPSIKELKLDSQLKRESRGNGLIGENPLKEDTNRNPAELLPHARNHSVGLNSNLIVSQSTNALNRGMPSAPGNMENGYVKPGFLNTSGPPPQVHFVDQSQQTINPVKLPQMVQPNSLQTPPYYSTYFIQPQQQYYYTNPQQYYYPPQTMPQNQFEPQGPNAFYSSNIPRQINPSMRKYYPNPQNVYIQPPHNAMVNMMGNQFGMNLNPNGYHQQSPSTTHAALPSGAHQDIEIQIEQKSDTKSPPQAPYPLKIASGFENPHFISNKSSDQIKMSKFSAKGNKDKKTFSKKKATTHYKMKPKNFSDENKIDTNQNTNIIERVKKSLLKNRQGRPITLDLSVNITLYEYLEDYILHNLRKNNNLDYWFSHESVNNIMITQNYDSEANTEDNLTSSLREKINMDNLKEGDTVDVSNLDILKFLYLEKLKLQKKNLNFKVPVTKAKVICDPRIDSFSCFPKSNDAVSSISLDVFKKIKVQTQFAQTPSLKPKDDSYSNEADAENNEDVCFVKKAQILHTMKDSEESVLEAIKRKLKLAPNQKLAILKQYKRSMFPNETKKQLGNVSESKIVMFDYIPIVNEDEINIEFFKKIICYPKYRTNYDLVLIKRDIADPVHHFNNQIRCYFDKSLYAKVVEEYRTVRQDLYKYYVLKDINTALIGTMMSNYNGAINFQTHNKSGSSEHDDQVGNKNTIDLNLKGDFVTLPSGLEVFEQQPNDVWEKEKARYMCYDTWILDLD